MSEEILENVRQVASEIFDVPKALITPESSPATIAGWDSVQQLNLMLALEEEFSVKFEPEDLEHFQDIGHVAEAVQSKLGR